MKLNLFISKNFLLGLLVSAITYSTGINAKVYCAWNSCVPYKVSKEGLFKATRFATKTIEKFDESHDQKENTYSPEVIDEISKCEKWYGRWPLNCKIKTDVKGVEWTDGLLKMLDEQKKAKGLPKVQCSISFHRGPYALNINAYLAAKDTKEKNCVDDLSILDHNPYDSRIYPHLYHPKIQKEEEARKKWRADMARGNKRLASLVVPSTNDYTR
jgi:hypothetical protein